MGEFDDLFSTGFGNMDRGLKDPNPGLYHFKLSDEGIEYFCVRGNEIFRLRWERYTGYLRLTRNIALVAAGSKINRIRTKDKNTGDRTTVGFVTNSHGGHRKSKVP